MRKLIIAGAVALVLFIVGAFAASFAVDSEDVASGADAVLLIVAALTDAELTAIEQRFGFEFASDHRAFLAAGLPVWTAGDDDLDRAEKRALREDTLSGTEIVDNGDTVDWLYLNLTADSHPFHT